ncbi:hypothetical protein MBEHAL_0177 [Halarchaeum acidiphilum MH1-52-1]|uniref:Uncharacterized protein n=1 Tax=Halarchaeum acidiphilum MH1-52-1 TaxID=1261545 RepID=U2YRR8_9EURY|nr:SDR family NAD(P)-dependent oxidoreductase [Halarchaeum acidiphilum]GAD51417.1 hypothetical protein MBEHAL_0177 [Halarchaeum acidiphilum MH1-52-1]
MSESPVAVVIGSTNNIGRAIAERLSADGYHAIVTSRHGDEAETVADASRAWDRDTRWTSPSRPRSRRCSSTSRRRSDGWTPS